MSYFSKTLLLTFCLSSPWLTVGCANAPSPQSTAAATAQTKTDIFEVDLKKGEVLQLLLVRSKESEEARAVQQKYFQTVIPEATRLGAKNYGILPISQTLISETKPQVISVFTFPSLSAQETFRSHSDWDNFKQMRREAWDQLDVFSVVMTDDMTFRFDPNKDYTMAAAWTHPDTMPDYQRYLDGIEADFEAIGAKYVAQLNGVSLQSETDSATEGPSQLTIVEWSDGVNLSGLQKTQGYKDNAGSFQKAISRFDLYAFKPQKSS